MLRKGILLVTALAAVACAHAALAPINARGGGDGSERCLVGPLCSGGAYSGALSIVRSFEIDLGLAAGALERVDDGFDRRWAALGADPAVLPIARYAADDSRFAVTADGRVSTVSGILANGRVLVPNPLAFGGTPHASDYQSNGSAWTPFGLAPQAEFAFVLDNLTSHLQLASDTALAGFANSGLPQAWIVRWRVPGEDLYLVAWEDRAMIGSNGLPNDYDYNDYVFAVRDVTPLVTPLPGTSGPLTGGAAMLALLAMRKKKKRRHCAGAEERLFPQKREESCLRERSS